VTVVGAPHTASHRTRNSTTARTLRRLRVALFALTAVAMVTSFAAFVGVKTAVGAATEHSIPAMMAVSAASEALAEADSAAVHSFGAGQALITGPGSEYQAKAGLAGQNLEQIAETGQAGEPVSQQLLLIENRLTEYRQLIEQAHADYVAGSVRLGTVEMVYASRLMHTGVLAELGKLGDLERQALADQASSFRMSPWALVIWLLLALALLGLLTGTLVFLARRFRRTVNWWLSAAAVVLIGVTAYAAATAETSKAQLEDARSSAEQLLRDRTPQFGIDPAGGAVAARLNQECTTGGTTCGRVKMAASQPVQVAHAAVASARAGEADDSNGIEFAIPVAGLGIALLVYFGLQPRIQEYRYRSR
jgi:hypothetical protein